MNPTPQPRCSVLYIDDEEKALKYFRMSFSSKFSILTARSGEEGLDILRKEAGKIGVVVSDQRMPGMIGAEVLGAVREEFPHIVRILTTAYSDLDSAILAVNKGHIYQYVVKPWDVTELEMVLLRASDYYQILTERNELLRLKMSTLQRIICCDRVKWLLLEFGAGELAGPFRRALFSLIRSLEDSPAPGQMGGGVYRADQFDSTLLIQREFRSGIQLKAVLGDEGGKSAAYPGCEQVSQLGEKGRGLAEELGAFLATIPAEVEVSVEASDGVGVTLSPSSPAFVEELTGVLFAKEPRPSAMLLLKVLWKFAAAGIPLTVAVVRPGSEAFRISLVPQAVSPDDVLVALREVFERWDVASL